MTERRPLRGFSLGGTAVAGVVVGHWLAYTIAVPDPRVRVEVLAETGHGYWVLAVKAAVVLGITAIVTFTLRRSYERAGGETSGPEPFSSLVSRLAILQVLAFGAMEVTERVAAGVPVGSLLSHHVFALGVAVQLLVACAGAVMLRWFGRTAERICDLVLSIRLGRIGGARSPVPTDRVFLPAAPLAGAAGLRGPPPR
jgi:hypothetical protein